MARFVGARSQMEELFLATVETIAPSNTQMAHVDRVLARKTNGR
jgi:hypothetical protein